MKNAPSPTTLCLLLAGLVLAAPLTRAVHIDVISGLWRSTLGGTDTSLTQHFACTTGELGIAVTCTGVDLTNKALPSIVAAGYRLNETAYSLFFSGATGGNYTLVAPFTNTIINYPLGGNTSTPTKSLYVWHRIQ